MLRFVCYSTMVKPISIPEYFGESRYVLRLPGLDGKIFDERVKWGCLETEVVEVVSAGKSGALQGYYIPYRNPRRHPNSQKDGGSVKLTYNREMQLLAMSDGAMHEITEAYLIWCLQKLTTADIDQNALIAPRENAKKFGTLVVKKAGLNELGNDGNILLRREGQFMFYNLYEVQVILGLVEPRRTRRFGWR